MTVNVRQVIAERAVRTVFQPIVDLDDGAVVAYEALSRGPVGVFERPDVLFAAAQLDGLLAPLDALCRSTALRTAALLDWPEAVALFVNIEPRALDAPRLNGLVDLARSTPHHIPVVLEITERAIGLRPADLLACVRELRQAGWRVALDDVGADDMSLAFMPLLAPDVVKLDLKLVQERPGPAAARIMHAVNAYAESSGAVVLAEGIENETHLQAARALGARLGQGWLFGRPAPTPAEDRPTRPVHLRPLATTPTPASPFACLPGHVQLRTSTKPLLVELSKQLELQAVSGGSTCLVLSTFQHKNHFTASTSRRYEQIARQVAFVAAIGTGLSVEPARLVRGADLAQDDVLRDEWDIVVLAPHFAAALLARDLGDSGPEEDRRFEFALSYDRDVVTAAAEALMTRVAPCRHGATARQVTSGVDSPHARRARNGQVLGQAVP